MAADTMYTCLDCGHQELRKHGGIYPANVPVHCGKVMRAWEVEEYTDAQTGMRLTVEHDIPEHPRITAYPPDGIDIDALNPAIHRLMEQAGLLPEQKAGE